MNPICLLKSVAYFALVWACTSSEAALSTPSPNTTNQTVHLRYFVVTTGHELLEGIYPDSHTSFITRTLRPLGAQCVGSIAVDDQTQEIQQALKFASQKAPVVIVTGGLGPTEDDITRQCLSQYTGITLNEHPDLMSELSRRFKQKPEDIRPNLRRQTQVPVHGGYLPNSNGTAAGLIFESPGSIIIALPGPPKELQPMVMNELIPWLAKRFQTHSTATTLMLRFVGIGQSQIAQTLKDRVSMPPDIMMYSQFDEMRVDFTFALSGKGANDRQELLKLENQISSVLGDYIYANDNAALEEKIAEKMLTQSRDLILLEISSGGQLAASLNSKIKSTRPDILAWTAPSLAKLHGVLDGSFDKASSRNITDESVIQKAGTAAKTTNSWVVFVGEKDTNASGSKFKVILITPSKQSHSGWISVDKTGEISSARLTTQILDFIWRKIR